FAISISWYPELLKRDVDTNRDLCRLRAVFLGSVCAEHTSDLTRRCRQNARDLGRRGLDETDDLAAQSVEGGQRGESLDASDVHSVLAQRTAHDAQLLVVLGVGRDDLRRSDRILGVSDGSRTREHGSERLEGRAVEGTQHES